MSLEGSARGKTLVGKINKNRVQTISAYGIAVKNGFEGTEAEWLESLKADAEAIERMKFCGNFTGTLAELCARSIEHKEGDVWRFTTDGGTTHEQSIEAGDYVICVNGINAKLPSSWRVFSKPKSTGSGPSAKIGYVTLLSEAWVQDAENLYSQVVVVDGATVNSQVDLTPSVEQLAIFYNKDLSFVTENENGIVTVYAIGQKPQNDYTIQVTITEVIR